MVEFLDSSLRLFVMASEMCIGNDVVDLSTVEHQKTDRYCRRIFSPGEYKQYVGECAATGRLFRGPKLSISVEHPQNVSEQTRIVCDPSVVWRAWAAKEAAFKMLRQAGILEAFVPSRLTYCDRTSRIRYGNSVWPVRLSQNDRLVSAVVSQFPRWESIVGEISTLTTVKPDLFCAAELKAGCLNWPLESVAVRVLAKQYLARHFQCAPSDIEFSAPDKYSQPRGSICARRFDRGLSFSHDGRFAAVAISELLLG